MGYQDSGRKAKGIELGEFGVNATPVEESRAPYCETQVVANPELSMTRRIQWEHEFEAPVKTSKLASYT